MMTRWLSYIRLFDFTVKHIRGVKNGGADALSRRGKAEEDSEEDDDEVDEFFEAKMYGLTVSRVDSNPVAWFGFVKGSMMGIIWFLGSIWRLWSGLKG
jgi:hypothetical protein